MKKWYELRNCRIIHMDDNSVRYIITIDGKNIEVTEEVYKAYSTAERRERYLQELDMQHVTHAIQSFDEIPASLYALEHYQSIEDIVVEVEERKERRLLLKRMHQVLLMLSADEMKLIRALFFEKMSAREIARQKGITHRAVLKTRNRILKRILENLGS